MITVSVVSHNHEHLVREMILQLLQFTEVTQIIVTVNSGSTACFDAFSEDIEVVVNLKPLGFGKNHNNALKICKNGYFCILNPDVGFVENPFTVLIEEFRNRVHGLCCPLVVNSQGLREDSVRQYPTIMELVGKLFGHNSREIFFDSRDTFDVPWCAGMFMLFKREVFEDLDGFDEAFFMYYEDVDICARVWLHGYRVVCVPEALVVHDGSRASHNSFMPFLIHLKSFCIYQIKYRFGSRLPDIWK